MKPRSCRNPVALDCRGRDSQHFRRVFNRKAAEELEFDDLALLRIHGRECFEGIVERHDIDIDLLCIFLGFVQGESANASSAFVGAIGARVVYQNLAHQLSSHGKEVGAVLPLRKILPDQANVRFVDQSSAL